MITAPPSTNVNTNSFYYDAFASEMMAIWGFTKFANEIPQLCFERMKSCWLQNDELGEESRRRALYSFLKPIFSTNDKDDTLNKLYPLLSSDNTFIARATKNLCVAYNSEVTRSFDGNDELTERMNTLLSECSFDSQMRIAYQLSKLCEEVVLRPVIRTRNGVKKLEMEVLPDDLYRVQRDSYGNPLEMWIPYHEWEGKKLRRYFNVWDADVFRVADAEGKFIPFTFEGQSYTQLPNKYKRIPYTPLSLGINNVYNLNLWEVVKEALRCNALDLMEFENVTYSGFTMWLFTNLGLSDPKDLKLGPGRAFIVEKVKQQEDAPLPPNAEAVNSSGQYNEIFEYKLARIKNILKQVGIPSSVVDDNAGRLSGVALKIDRLELEQIRREDLVSLRAFENEALPMLDLIEKTDRPEGAQKAMAISIDFPELETYSDPKEEYALLKEKFADGLISPRDYVRILTGDTTITTDEAAMIFIQKNKSFLKPTNEVANGSPTEQRRAGDSGEHVAAENPAGSAEGQTSGSNQESGAAGQNSV